MRLMVRILKRWQRINVYEWAYIISVFGTCVLYKYLTNYYERLHEERLLDMTEDEIAEIKRTPWWFRPFQAEYDEIQEEKNRTGKLPIWYKVGYPKEWESYKKWKQSSEERHQSSRK